MSDIISATESIRAMAEAGMQKALEALNAQFAKLRTGRAHPGLLESVRVTCSEGAVVLLPHLATIHVQDARTLTVSPWDKSLLTSVEKAIRSAELVLNPVVVGPSLKVPLPPLSEGRRRDFVRLVKQEAEQARNAVRHHRREANHQLKALLKRKAISEDEDRRAQEAIQTLTDALIVKIDKTAAVKEQQLMEV